MSCRRRPWAGSRMINWADLVASAAAKVAGNAGERGCPRPTSGNKGTEAGTESDAQPIEKTELVHSCSRVPAVPAIFEHHRERPGNIAPRVSGGGEVAKGSAPESKDAGRGCVSCCHLRRPGLSDGYCGGDRPDLRPAYGPGHPLRALPRDGGAGCGGWVHGGGP